MDGMSVQPSQVRKVVISAEDMAQIQKEHFEMNGALVLMRDLMLDPKTNKTLYEYLSDRYINCQVRYQLATQMITQKYGIVTGPNVNLNFNFITNEVEWYD
jgi:hypothetical protein